MEEELGAAEDEEDLWKGRKEGRSSRSARAFLLFFSCLSILRRESNFHTVYLRRSIPFDLKAVQSQLYSSRDSYFISLPSLSIDDDLALRVVSLDGHERIIQTSDVEFMLG